MCLQVLRDFALVCTLLHSVILQGHQLPQEEVRTQCWYPPQEEAEGLKNFSGSREKEKTTLCIKLYFIHFGDKCDLIKEVITHAFTFLG